MIEWTDNGIVLSASPLGEMAARVSLITADHGRHIGSLPYGQSQKVRSLLQPGACVAATWKARLEGQMGAYALEPEAPYPYLLLDDPMGLACLNAACALLESCLPEREPHPDIYHATRALFQDTPHEAIAYAYVRWEVGVLQSVGYGLQLNRCGATGKLWTDDDPFTFVSPRSGRAVCQSAAEPYASKLIPLPAFLIGKGPATPEALRQGVELTAFFLEQYAFAVHHARLPVARYRLHDKIMEETCLNELA